MLGKTDARCGGQGWASDNGRTEEEERAYFGSYRRRTRRKTPVSTDPVSADLAGGPRAAGPGRIVSTPGPSSCRNSSSSALLIVDTSNGGGGWRGVQRKKPQDDRVGNTGFPEFGMSFIRQLHLGAEVLTAHGPWTELTGRVDAVGRGASKASSMSRMTVWLDRTGVQGAQLSVLWVRGAQQQTASLMQGCVRARGHHLADSVPGPRSRRVRKDG